MVMLKAENNKPKTVKVAKQLTKSSNNSEKTTGATYGTGRRKSAIARVWLKAGSGKIVVNKQNRNIYVTYDGGTYVNATTGISGTVTEEQAKNTFAIPVELNSMIEQNPNVLKLITSLSLSLEK